MEAPLPGPPTIRYFDPLARAFARMRGLLFGTLDPARWLALGFASFLAGLADSGLAGGVGWTWRVPRPMRSWRDLPLLLGVTRSTLDALSAALLGVLVAFAVLFLVTCLWIGSRGKFVFLDDVLRERSAIVEPWQRFEHVAQSLFWWRVGFWLVVLVLATAVLSPILLFGPDGSGGDAPTWSVFPALGAGLVGLVACVVVAFTWLFLESFVVPIMHARGIGASAAWGRLLRLVAVQPVEFVIYAVFVLVLGVAAGLLLFALSLATCCVGPALLAVPYLSSVVLLPLSVTFRLFGVEFLAQFGPQHMLQAPADA